MWDVDADMVLWATRAASPGRAVCCVLPLSRWVSRARDHSRARQTGPHQQPLRRVMTAGYPSGPSVGASSPIWLRTPVPGSRCGEDTVELWPLS